jgi:hypothetical protein
MLPGGVERQKISLACDTSPVGRHSNVPPLSLSPTRMVIP